MKNINIKISREVSLIVGLVLFIFLPFGQVNADLDDKFRENFSEIIKDQYHNSIEYKVDDETGWKFIKKNGEEKWSCTGGKCEEYQHKITCLFDNAFQEAVNQTNAEVSSYSKEKIKGFDQKIELQAPNCKNITLENIQDEQETNGFKTSCSGDFLSKPYSACRVTETILNELGAYQNYLLSKIEDAISFSRENFEHDDYKNEVFQALAKTKKQYLNEIKKSQKAALTSLMLYKDFVHNYRAHAWLIAIKNKLQGLEGKWLEIQKAIETFPTKFINANSLGG